MKLDAPLIELFDHPIDGFVPLLPPDGDALWNVATFRQARYKEHDATRSIVFEWLDGDWRPPAPPIVFRASYAPKPLAALAYGFAEALRKVRPGKITKLMLAALPPGGEIKPHVDRQPALTDVHRCHLPIVSGDAVAFRIDETDFRLKPGKAYEVDNLRRHSVTNAGGESRVHLICDILPA